MRIVNARSCAIGLRGLLLFGLCCVFMACGSGESTLSSAKSDDATTDTASEGARAVAKSSIPASTVIDDLLKSSDPKRFDLIAKCQVVATTVLGSSLGLDYDASVKASLDRLVTVARQYDPVVADALAKSPRDAAAWCKSTGMVVS
jgi:hypothetical protein